MNPCTSLELPRRDYVYVSTPSELCYGPCPLCGESDYLWSTFERHVWCLKCERDVRPEHYGVVDGPVTYECCKMMGMNLDAFDLLAHIVIPFESPFYPRVENLVKGLQ